MHLGRQRLDAYADKWWQQSCRICGSYFLRDGSRVTVLFGIRPDAIAVLEVDAKVFDRLHCQLVLDACAHDSSQFWLEPECADQAACVRRVIVKREPRRGAEFADGVRPEEMCATVECVNRLASVGFARI
jgi:hypothetical protein